MCRVLLADRVGGWDGTEHGLAFLFGFGLAFGVLGWLEERHIGCLLLLSSRRCQWKALFSCDLPPTRTMAQLSELKRTRLMLDYVLFDATKNSVCPFRSWALALWFDKTGVTASP